MGIPVWAVYHPSAGLRNTHYRRLLAADLGALAESLGIAQLAPASDVQVVSALDMVAELLEDRPDVLAVDTETDGRCEGVAALLGVGLAWRARDGHIKARYSPGWRSVPWLGRMAEEAQYAPVLVAHNTKFDARILRRYGWDLFRNRVDDTMVMAYVLRRGQFVGGLGLKELLPADTKYHISSLAVLGDPTELDEQTLGNYGAQDSAAALRLYEEYTRRLNAEPRLRQVYERLDRPVIEVTAAMEDTGFHLDLDALAAVRPIAQAQRDHARASLADAGLDNPNSPAQVVHFLYDRLRLPVLETTKAGNPSSEAKVLRALLAGPGLTEQARDAIAHLLDFKEADKLLTGFIQNLPGYVQPSTGRVHTHFNNAFVETGRYSSSQPINFQNIPNRTRLGKAVRRAMAAPPGKVLIKADYSQLEMRILAAFSRDPALLRAFAAGIDVHVSTASAMLGVPVDRVSPDQRSQGKQLNFATVYGQGHHSLAQSLHISPEDAKVMLRNYWAKLPRVDQWIRWAQEDAREHGYSETWFGRRNYYPDLNDERAWVRHKAERESVNMRIQGTGGDLMRLFMQAAYAKLVKPGYAEIPAQVHDELVFFADPKIAPELCLIIKDLGEHVADIGVPLELEVKVGRNWADVESTDKEDAAVE